MPDGFVFRHFWLLFLAVMLVNVAIWRRRLDAAVAAGQATREDVSGFLRGAAVALAVYSLAAEAIVLAAGWPNALCFYGEPWSAPGALAMWALTLLAWALLLAWVWLGAGAERLARLGPVLTARPQSGRTYSARQVRLYVTGLIALVAVGLAVTLPVMPPMPRCVSASGRTNR